MVAVLTGMGESNEARELTLGTFNIERFGHEPGRGHHRLPAALEWLLEQTPVPPDILALPEATKGLDDGQRAIRRLVVGTLAPRLERGWYEPLFSSRPVNGRRNHLHLLLVNTAKVVPVAWHDPGRIEQGRHYDGFDVCCEHWSGGEGRTEFERAAHRLSTWSRRKTLVLGDFNADSGWEGELHHRHVDWYGQCRAQGDLHKLWQKGRRDPETGRWVIDTRQMDMLREEFGYRDLGEQFGDPPPRPRPGGGSRFAHRPHPAQSAASPGGGGIPGVPATAQRQRPRLCPRPDVGSRAASG